MSTAEQVKLDEWYAASGDLAKKSLDVLNHLSELFASSPIDLPDPEDITSFPIDNITDDNINPVEQYQIELKTVSGQLGKRVRASKRAAEWMINHRRENNLQHPLCLSQDPDIDSARLINSQYCFWCHFEVIPSHYEEYQIWAGVVVTSLTNAIANFHHQQQQEQQQQREQSSPPQISNHNNMNNNNNNNNNPPNNNNNNNNNTIPPNVTKTIPPQHTNTTINSRNNSTLMTDGSPHHSLHQSQSVSSVNTNSSKPTPTTSVITTPSTSTNLSSIPPPEQFPPFNPHNNTNDYQYQQENQQYQQQQQQQQQIIDDYKNQLVTLQVDNQTIQNKLDFSNNIITNLNNNLSEANKTIDLLRQTEGRQRVEMNTLQHQLQQSNEEIKNLRQKITDLERINLNNQQSFPRRNEPQDGFSSVGPGLNKFPRTGADLHIPPGKSRAYVLGQMQDQRRLQQQQQQPQYNNNNNNNNNNNRPMNGGYIGMNGLNTNGGPNSAALTGAIRGQNNNNNNNNNNNLDANGETQQRTHIGPIELQPDGTLPEELKGLDINLIESVIGDLVTGDTGTNWEDVIGLKHCKDALNESLVWPMIRPELYKGLRTPPKGLLLFGPPGTGKTMLGKAIANECGARFFSISSSSLTSKWMGQGEKMVKTLFSVCRYLQPCVLFIDEIDSLLAARSATENDGMRRIKTELLVQMDGINASVTNNQRNNNQGNNNPYDEDQDKKSQVGLIVIGATNLPSELDSAASRRLPTRLYVPLPGFMARRQLFDHLLKQAPEGHNVNKDDIIELARMTRLYSAADIQNVCRSASMMPLHELTANIKASSNKNNNNYGNGDDDREETLAEQRQRFLSLNNPRPMNFQDFKTTILNKVKASVDEKALDTLYEFQEKYGSAPVPKHDEEEEG